MNGDPFYATFDFCTGQCWYDQDVATPPGQPDTVFVIGSYTYGEPGLRSNARAVVRSTTAGEPDPANGNRTFTDMTWDAQPTPYGIHPDQHEIAFHPIEPGHLVQQLRRRRGAIERRLCGRVEPVRRPSARRRQHADLPPHAVGGPVADLQLNEGLTTLQFMSVSVNPLNPTGEVMGGTQDNGTWLYDGNTKRWNQTIYGDGGTAASTSAIRPSASTSSSADSVTSTSARAIRPRGSWSPRRC